MWSLVEFWIHKPVNINIIPVCRQVLSLLFFAGRWHRARNDHIHLIPKAWSEHGVETLWTGQKIFLWPVHKASTPCSLQAFGIRCIWVLQTQKGKEVKCHITPEQRWSWPTLAEKPFSIQTDRLTSDWLSHREEAHIEMTLDTLQLRWDYWKPHPTCHTQMCIYPFTGRTLTTRLGEHQTATDKEDLTNNIAQHHRKTGHDINWDSATCLTHSTDKDQTYTWKLVYQLTTQPT